MSNQWENENLDTCINGTCNVLMHTNIYMLNTRVF